MDVEYLNEDVIHTGYTDWMIPLKAIIAQDYQKVQIRTNVNERSIFYSDLFFILNLLQ